MGTKISAFYYTYQLLISFCCDTYFVFDLLCAVFVFVWHLFFFGRRMIFLARRLQFGKKQKTIM